MTNAELARRQERARSEALVIAATEDGLRVHAVSDPKRSHLVTGTAAAPRCTCLDFQAHGADPEWRCKHILAALPQLPTGNGPAEQDPHELEERRAIQQDGRGPQRKRAEGNGVGPAQMLVKRSVSPDGRIDSLSVEFACPVDRVPADEIKDRARRILALQSEIVSEFLERPATSNGVPVDSGNGSPAVPARVIAVGGLDGRWGRRLYLTVTVEGRTAKLFGTRQQLGDALTAIGAGSVAAVLEERMDLDLPCRAIVKPTDDGRFLNVERLLPAEIRPASRRVK